MKIAFVYDRVTKWGGAERVLLALHKIFPDAPLYTSVYNKQKAVWAKIFVVHTSFLQKIPFFNTRPELLAPFMPLAFESFSFDEYDLVISVSSEAAKGIITKPHTLHINICLTPTRYLWSGYSEYFSSSLFAFFATPFLFLLRQWDIAAAQRPDAMIAISQVVSRRIKEYYHRDVPVIYPPSVFEKGKESKPNALSLSSGFFLCVSRLSRFTPYKRIDIAIQAAAKAKVPLVIVGEGDASFLQTDASDVIFLGQVSEEELRYCYSHCKALVFPGNEDFGLAMVEAQLLGKPVIAYEQGGALEIVREGKTGRLFPKQDVKILTGILKTFDESLYNRKDCEENARKFSYQVFAKNLQAYVAQQRKK